MKHDPKWEAFKNRVAIEDNAVDSIADVPLDAENPREQSWNPVAVYSSQNPKSEVSADANYIAGRVINHLWILLFIMPVIAMICYAVLVAFGDIK
jgi:hypothetical protein